MSEEGKSAGPLLKRITKEEVCKEKSNDIDATTRQQSADIMADVKDKGEQGLLEHAIRLRDIQQGAPHILSPTELKAAYDAIPTEQQELLQRTAKRISAFASAQLASLSETKVAVPGGFAGHTISPVERAGCYAPGGRFPLPSSVLMTACTARAAGVKEVWVASPRPAEITKAAAYVAGVDALLAVGGAQAIAAFAYGAGRVPACDSIVGPGNRWVTAAKALIAGKVNIDMLAGPSELLVFADSSAPADLVAADLLAQAEHDTDALPCLVTTSAALLGPLEVELQQQLAALPEASRLNATAALSNGFAVLVDSIEEGVAVCDAVAPEHLELLLEEEVAKRVAKECLHYGGLFVGKHSAEVLGDYGVGPNHTLPTSSTSRHSGGLSVFDFIRIRTWLELPAIGSQEGQDMVRDTMALADLEGLQGHKRSAAKRLKTQ